MLTTAEPPASSIKSFLALVLSFVFSPFICVPFFTLALVDAVARSRQEFYFLCLLLNALSVGVPLVYISWNVRRGKLKDLHVSDRAERQGPFRAGLVGLGLQAVALWSLGSPLPLLRFTLILIVQGLLFQVISRWWKISLHTGALGVCLAGCIDIAGWSPLCLLWLPPLAWARAYRKRHLWSQALLGGLLGYALTTLLYRFFIPF
jgi:hypothetical protein